MAQPADPTDFVLTPELLQTDKDTWDPLRAFFWGWIHFKGKRVNDLTTWPQIQALTQAALHKLRGPLPLPRLYRGLSFETREDLDNYWARLEREGYCFSSPVCSHWTTNPLTAFSFASDYPFGLVHSAIFPLTEYVFDYELFDPQWSHDLNSLAYGVIQQEEIVIRPTRGHRQPCRLDAWLQNSDVPWKLDSVARYKHYRDAQVYYHSQTITMVSPRVFPHQQITWLEHEEHFETLFEAWSGQQQQPTHLFFGPTDHERNR